jgi:hypothetical protein
MRINIYYIVAATKYLEHFKKIKEGIQFKHKMEAAMTPRQGDERGCAKDCKAVKDHLLLKYAVSPRLYILYNLITDNLWPGTFVSHSDV